MVVSIAKANIFLISNFIWHHLHVFLTGKRLSSPTANPFYKTICQEIMKLVLDKVAYQWKMLLYCVHHNF